ncbi:MAG: sodium-translocating pyrophosphatase [Candidatus Omnitrophota bacterium]|nr:sodium-translocating pyrophosphatase [Candidatus Omnitrophota bacterium]
MNWIGVVPIIGALICAVFVRFLIRKIKSADEGDAEMKKVSAAVREGAFAYLKRQYTSVGIYAAFFFVVLIVMELTNFLPLFSGAAFLTGTLCSALAGFIGMNIATQSSHRTTAAARYSLNGALRIAFSSGAVMGLTVVGLALANLGIWYLILNWYYRFWPEAEAIRKIGATLFCAGMGASGQALFARVGGGIFTKGADVGADLVGKIEIGIPEDDPRNPAVIADNVGDNVGDIVGMGADLYESYLGSIVAAIALSVAAGLSYGGVALPMIFASAAAVASIAATFFVRTGEKTSQAQLLTALRRGTYGASVLTAIFAFILVRVITPGHFGIFWAIMAGLVGGNLIGLITEYFTSDNYRPTKQVAESAKTGPATVILEGISTGMFSTLTPVLVVVIACLSAYYLSGGKALPELGLYGIAMAAVGMLSTLGITLATDAYGPVADNAGGNAEMTHQKPEVRERTDALDSLGNTTAATGKGLAIGSAALTALALLVSFRDQVILLVPGKLTFSVMDPNLIAGIFIGAVYPFFFCSMTIKAVGRCAQQIVEEVRRQFRTIVGLMEGKAKPDYARAVDICTRGALKEMLPPSIITIVTPIAVGIFLGVEGVMGLLVGAITCGFAVALFMANSGAAWDNAKKYIERGHLGGKKSDPHKAAVIGDTVGDPFKDTAGPSLNIMIKLMAIVSIVFSAFIVKFSLF